MKNYYILINNFQKGPVTKEQLKDIDIDSSTLIWAEGMDDWTNANNIDELDDLIKQKPPPTPQSDLVEHQQSKKKDDFLNATMFSQNTNKTIRQTSLWLKYFSVLGFLFGGFIIIRVFLNLINTSISAANFFSNVFMFLFSLLVLFSSRYLFKYSFYLSNFIKSNNKKHIELAFLMQKNYWKFFAITMIIFLIYVFTLLFIFLL